MNVMRTINIIALMDIAAVRAVYPFVSARMGGLEYAVN